MNNLDISICKLFVRKNRHGFIKVVVKNYGWTRREYCKIVERGEN